MDGRERGGRWGRRALIASAALALGPAVAPAGDDAPNVRLINNSERFAVVRALGGAARALGHLECQALLDEFADGSGRPLRSALQASGMTAPEYLGGGFFYDSPTPLSGGSGEHIGAGANGGSGCDGPHRGLRAGACRGSRRGRQGQSPVSLRRSPEGTMVQPPHGNIQARRVAPGRPHASATGRSHGTPLDRAQSGRVPKGRRDRARRRGPSGNGG